MVVTNPVGNVLKCIKGDDELLVFHEDSASPYYHLYRAFEAGGPGAGELVDAETAGVPLIDVPPFGMSYYNVKGANCQGQPGP